MLVTLRKVIALLDARERWRLAGVFCLMLLMGLVQMVGVASIMPFMAIVSDPDRITTNRWFAPFYEALGFASTQSFLLFAGFVVLGIMVFSNSLRAFTSWCLLRFSWGVHCSLSLRLLDRYLSEPYSFYLSRNTTHLAKNILAEVKEVVDGTLVPGLNMVAHGFVTLAILSLIVLVNPLVALIAAVVFGGAFGMLHVLVRRKQLRLGKARHRMHAARYRIAMEALAGIKETKVLGREAEFVARFAGPSREYARANASNAAMSELPKYALETLAFGGIVVLVLYLLGTHGSLEQAIPLISLYAVASYRLMPSLQQVFKGIAKVRFFLPAVENLHADLSGGISAGGRPHVAVRDASEPLPFVRDIVVDGICFRYPAREEYVVRDLHLRIPRNSTVGFVGSTGSGKTTLVDIMLGLLDPEQGSIRVDGVPLGPDTLVSWRRMLGYVPQTIFLCDDTLTRNIAFGLPDEQIDRSAVERAARIANLHDFVGSLPQGYETVVGDRGVRLSGGQRQRIGIARALYHNPSVLFLDEATSALDNITEDAVMTALHSLAGKKTIVIVAHRLSTLQQCDTIFVLKNGSVHAQGRYRQLIDENDDFMAMARVSKTVVTTMVS